MGLSSNSLIHFTKDFSSIKGILTDNFKIRYCREKINTKEDVLDILVPMVSFCDIPFSQIVNHIQSYGCYGVGLSKKWAESKGLNPVLYIDQKSSLGDNFIKQVFKRIVTKEKAKVSDLTLEEKYIFDIFRYMKNYQGDLERHGKKTIKNYRFSDEREWRYVLKPESDLLPFGNCSKLTSDKIIESKRKRNELASKERLQFSPDDIAYIIIKKDSEREKLIDELNKIRGRFLQEELRRLSSRIISTEQILTDF